ELERTFRVPLYPVSPVLGVAFCLYLMYGTGWATWVQFAVFLAAGSLLYACYGRKRSRLVSSPGTGPAGTVSPEA
ncbi:amino acid permease, partial [Streptomyces sp. SID8455]|nr:amino acid permease [Streptomyces sp. SID8455]